MPGTWGTETIIFSKPQVHQIVYGSTLTSLSKLEKHWRITHDFMPTAYNVDGGFTLNLLRGTDPAMIFSFTTTTTMICCEAKYWGRVSCLIKEVPKIGGWTTIDVINEELEPGKCTFTVLLDGRQVFKDEKSGTRELANVGLFVGATVNYTLAYAQQGFIRGLTIMTKK